MPSCQANSSLDPGMSCPNLRSNPGHLAPGKSSQARPVRQILGDLATWAPGPGIPAKQRLGNPATTHQAHITRVLGPGTHSLHCITKGPRAAKQSLVDLVISANTATTPGLHYIIPGQGRVTRQRLGHPVSML